MKFILFLSLIATFCTARGNVVQNNALASGEHKGHRLPKTLKPLHYFVRLQPFLGSNFTTDGYVEIMFRVSEPTSTIILHMKNIITHNDTVKVAPMKTSSEPPVKILSQKYDPTRDFYIATLNQELKKGQRYELKMAFTGLLAGLRGFYPSSYTNENGEKIFIAATQFQAIDARKAFPCFDEPAFKATFAIELVRQETMTALSNMPLVKSTPIPNQPGWIADRFATSVPMSTYLVAFIISDFAHLTSPVPSDTTFTVWARKTHINQAKYALEKGQQMLDFFSKYFQIKFPLPKIDMVAIPDFGPGAMENWGLITYRELLMLYDPLKSAARYKDLVGNVVAHELAHQWFGDIVTPSWWTDIWLNEGFANYLQAVAYDHVEPELLVLDRLMTKSVHPAMQADSLDTSHPVNMPIHKADEMLALNPKITYDKGASLLRMLANFLTEQTFKQGLTNYMNSYVYSNAEQSDLWRYLSEQARLDNSLPADLSVKDIMDTWTLQKGYPVLSVQIYENGTAIFTQERFLSTKLSNNQTDTQEYKWFIPITKSTQTNPDFLSTNPKIWKTPDESEKTIDGFGDPLGGWTIVNNLQTGFYRTMYDQENWNKIIRQLTENHLAIHSLNRAQLLTDSFQLAKAGYVSYDTPLRILNYLSKESDFVPLRIGLSEARFVETSLIDSNLDAAFKKFLMSVLVPIYEAIGFQDSLADPHLEQLKRPLVLGNACYLGHKLCLQTAKETLQEYMKTPMNDSILSPNVKSLIYCYAIQEGTNAEWEFAWAQYQKTQITSEKNLLLSVLGCTKNTTIRSIILEKSFSEGSEIRKQDAAGAFRSVSRDKEGGKMAWNYLKQNWDKIFSYVDDVRSVAGLVKASTRYLYLPEELKEVKDFFKSLKDFSTSGTRLVDQAIEEIEGVQAWRKTNIGAIQNWMLQNGHAL